MPAHPRSLRQPRRRGRARSRAGTGCWTAPSSARSRACPGATRGRAPTSCAPRCSRLYGNANDGVMCPVSMTYAAIPALRDGAPELAAEWEPRLTDPDPAAGALAGMAMTERQGGSDVRANITRAEPAGDGVYELHGHKWFCSYPPCDVFLVLAQAPGGLSCFLVQRGPGMEFQRLKDKLGTRSLPSSEVEFRGAVGPSRRRGRPWRAGHHPHGQPHAARLPARRDHQPAPRAPWRRSITPAIAQAFGAPLADQPAMRNVLADLAIESEAATAAALRVARCYDEPGTGPLRRMATAVMKYWVSKRAPAHAAEALECLGGNGFVEDSGLPLALPRRAAELDLGGIGQRGRARRPARDRARVRCAARLAGRVRAGRRGRRPAGRPPAAGQGPSDGELRAPRRPGAAPLRKPVRRPAPGRGPGRGPAGIPAGPPRAGRGQPTRSARRACNGEGGRVYGTLPRGVDAGAIIDRAWPETA